MRHELGSATGPSGLAVLRVGGLQVTVLLAASTSRLCSVKALIRIVLTIALAKPEKVKSLSSRE